VARALGAAVAAARPATLLVPHRGDAHTDHRVAADAAASCAKWFRHPAVKRVLAYETLSETDAALHGEAFRPDLFVGVERELPEKTAILGLYAGESAPHPFPRGATAVTALARARGAQAGLPAAEAFMLLKEAA
jgi:LmbE family N-acetylglucosaminyl deacetylase